MEWCGPVADESVEVELGDRGRGALELELRDARRGLEDFVTSPDNFGLAPALFQAGVDARQANVERIERELAELGDVDAVEAIRATLREVWYQPETTIDEKRALLAVVLDRVEVRRGTAKGRARKSETVASRVRITFRDGSTA